MKTWENFITNDLPTKRDERWKYADLSFLSKQTFELANALDMDKLEDGMMQHRLQRGNSILLVLVNGVFIHALSDMQKLPKGVIACEKKEAIEKHAALFKAHAACKMEMKPYPFAELNDASSPSGLFFYMEDDVSLDAPLHVLSVVTDEKAVMVQSSNIFMLGKRCEVTVMEDYFSLSPAAYLQNSVTTWCLDREAKLTQCKIQNEGPAATHIAHAFVYQKQGSETRMTNFSVGALFARDEVVFQLQEADANCSAAGFYWLQGNNQYIDHHIDVNHAAPHSRSEMLYKGIIDHQSRAVFNGRLHIAKDAQKIVAYQANHHILLSKQAEAYSKPELEIYADDVKCKHGATTGQLDQDALFYLRSRGVSEYAAKQMLLQGFADEIIARITHPGIKMRVIEMMANCI